MPASAALLVDLEPFYLARRDRLRAQLSPASSTPRYTRLDLYLDLKKLLRFARDIARAVTLPLPVMRAYVDLEWELKGERPFDATSLRDLAIIPIHMPRLAMTRDKNATDIRLALDAYELALRPAPSVSHFILVVGDSDYIPLIIKLKEAGATVSIIAPSPAVTQPLYRAYCDRYDTFDDLEIIFSREPPAGGTLDSVKRHLHTMLPNAESVLTLSAAARGLQRPLREDLGTGLVYSDILDLLRQYHDRLGILVRTHAKAETIQRWTARHTTPPHTAQDYADLLQEHTFGRQRDRYFIVSKHEWLTISGAVHDCLDGKVMFARELEDAVTNACRRARIVDPYEKVCAILFQLQRTGAIQNANARGQGMHRKSMDVWKLMESCTTREALQDVVRLELTRILEKRLAARSPKEHVRPEVLAELLDEPDYTQADLERCEGYVRTVVKGG
jgi:uncharacterized LabA/DUF88 family protein